MLIQYNNGNTKVTILDDGTKIREFDNDVHIEHPESIDLKITDYCDLGCSYCHESSTKIGKQADLNKLLEIIKDLPAGVELAIGGGNPLSHPNLIDFLQKLKLKGIISNITINQGHLKTYFNLIKHLIENDLIKGIGISITSNNFKYIKKLKLISDHIVYHLIAGINELIQLKELILIGNCKVLILGYKQYGFGVDFYTKAVEDNIEKWRMFLPQYIGKCVLCFDNLAIEQLKIKNWFTDAGWNKFYMGEDFTYTMYIDAVKQEFAPTSRTKTRLNFNELSLLEYFQRYRIHDKVDPLWK